MQDCDLNEIILNHIFNNGLYPHQKDSMNTFYNKGIEEILTKIFKIVKRIPNMRNLTEEDRSISTIQYEVIFKKVNLSKPYETNNIPLYPADCRLKDKSYKGSLTANVLLRLTAFKHNGEQKVREEELTNFNISGMPIMVGSMYCHTYGLDAEALEKIGEDPNDPQGIFIVNGTEWTISNLIGRKYNLWYTFHNEHDREHARAEYISIPGDSFENSSEMIIKYNKNGEITITLTSDKYFKIIELPFYVVLRLFGMPTEKDIINTIIGENNKNSNDFDKMREILNNAFLVNYGYEINFRYLNDFSELCDNLIETMAIKYVESKGYISKEEREKYILVEKKILKEVIMSNFDTNIMPHMGKAPENRFSKALFICIGIHKMLLCYLDKIPSTNRDSNDMKRIQPVGDIFSKLFKKVANKVIVNYLKVYLAETALNSPFSTMDIGAIFRTACNNGGLEALIINNLNQGMKTENVNGKNVKNRTPSEHSKRKNQANQLNQASMLRSINSAQAFSNQRNKEMRENQASNAHTSCMMQTGENLNVGLMQNTTLGVCISTSTSTEIMTNIISELDIIKYDELRNINNVYTKVYINGLWLGYVKKPYDLYNYISYRRRGWDINTCKRIESDIMDKKLTIYWDREQKEIDFRTDRGRSLAPYIVVYNNYTDIGATIIGKKCDKKTGKGFEQKILITPDILEKLKYNKIRTEELLELGYIDYIAPEELKLIVCAQNLRELEENKNNPYKVYTHLCIPATFLSLISALTPYTHNCPPTRISYATNQLRQSCGVSAINFNKRTDSQSYNQTLNESPLTPTISNTAVKSGGMNCIVAIMPFEGKGVEDSLIGNKSAFQNGLFYVNKYTYYKVKPEKDERFGLPTHGITDNMNVRADYSKLDETGIIKVGTKIKYNDVLVGKLLHYNEIKTNGAKFRDASVIYSEQEEAYVIGIETGIDGELNHYVKIRLEIPREMSVGQKMSSRNGQKGMIASSECQINLPFTSSGIIPSLILNPHAFPSRMTLNQMKEAISNLYATYIGEPIDSSFSIISDDEAINKVFRENGILSNGTEIMFNPKTGKYYNTSIFIAPTYYCRLQKFSEESEYAIGTNGQCNYITRQAISGRSRGGGLKLGEMEKDCLFSHGVIRFYTSKLRRDSDGIDIYICIKCGNEAIGNKHKNLSKCITCGVKGQIYRFPTRFASHLVLTAFKALGIGIKYNAIMKF